MTKALTFIIPVRHQNNAFNWDIVKTHLADTIRSIENQESKNWRAIIVANHGALIPSIPDGFEVKRIDFPPNPKFEIGTAPIEDIYDAVRKDKGRRVLAGMLHAGAMEHVMIVDDDDFISRKLTSFIERNKTANGFYFQQGYIWGDGGHWLFHYDGDFSKQCGTSHIIRADLYNLPKSIEQANCEYVSSMLGSHIFIREFLKNNDTPLAPLPFIGAVYRVGHAENHSKSNDMLTEYFLQKWLWRKPLRQIRRLMRLRILSANITREFFSAKSFTKQNSN